MGGTVCEHVDETLQKITCRVSRTITCGGTAGIIGVTARETIVRGLAAANVSCVRCCMCFP